MHEYPLVSLQVLDLGPHDLAETTLGRDNNIRCILYNLASFEVLDIYNPSNQRQYATLSSAGPTS